MMKIRVFDTQDAAGLYAASLAERVMEETSQPVLGCATGGTMVPFYRALVNLHRCGLSLADVTTLNLDEYIGLPADHPQSYATFMETHLWQHVDVERGRVHVPNGSASDVTEECRRYDALLAAHPIDLQMLGIGINGHIGFNEPSDLLMAQTHVVNLSDKTMESNARFFADRGEVPRQAITMGVQAILQAKRIVLMAFGEEKASIIAKAVDGEVRTDIPASILQLHRDVTIVLDAGSARDLRLPVGVSR